MNWSSVAEWLKGKKTYAMVVIAFIYGGGIQIGLWPHNAALDVMLAGCTVASLRAGIAKAGPTALLALCLIPSAICVIGCATIRTVAQLDLPFIQTESQLACGAALQLAVSSSDRAEVAAMIYSVADTVDQLSDGTALTPDQFTAKVTAWGIGGASKYASIAKAVGAIWAKVYPSLQSDPKLAVAVLQKISAGCCDAARPYLNQ